MNNRVIDKTVTTDFLDELLQAATVFAPVNRDGVLCFGSLSNGNEASLNAHNTRLPPKEVFFPRSETLFTYDGGQMAPADPPARQRVVVGIRACDARSVALLDKIFDTQENQDPYYVSRRKNTTLIGLSCNNPLSTCFCTSVGSGPFSAKGLDLLWTDLGDRYLVEPITERGEALIAHSSLFRPATEQDEDLKAKAAACAEQSVSGPSVQGIPENLDAMYDDPVWDGLRQVCLGCGLCTFLCPTCHCFDIVDEGDTVRGRRVRNWDTCQFSLFTRHASGHNPRPSSKERMRQRVMHKFNYLVKNLDEIGCVGCGRCVRECPVNLDIRAVLESVKQAVVK